MSKNEARRQMPRIFFASDLHGSELCFKKFLKAAEFYGADMLFLGGDYCPKELLLYSISDGHYAIYSPSGQKRTFENHEDFERFAAWCHATGRLLQEVDSPKSKLESAVVYNETYEQFVAQSLGRWRDLAVASSRANHVPIFVVPGNDDPISTDGVFTVNPFMFLHKQHVRIANELNILGWGGSNPTPWTWRRRL